MTPERKRMSHDEYAENLMVSVLETFQCPPDICKRIFGLGMLSSGKIKAINEEMYSLKAFVFLWLTSMTHGAENTSKITKSFGRLIPPMARERSEFKRMKESLPKYLQLFGEEVTSGWSGDWKDFPFDTFSLKLAQIFSSNCKVSNPMPAELLIADMVKGAMESIEDLQTITIVD